MFGRRRGPVVGRCEGCGTDRLPSGDRLCWECATHRVPEVSEFRPVGGHGRLAVAGSSHVSPAAELGSGWRSTAEHVWEGHRFEVHHHRESGVWRALVDGDIRWEAVADEAAADRVLAGLMTDAVTNPDAVTNQDAVTDPAGGSVGARAVRTDELPRLVAVPDLVDVDGQVDDDVVEELVTVDRRPIREDWQRSPAAAWARLREVSADAGYRLLYRVAHPWRTVRPLVGLWLAGLWWLVVRWVEFTFDADEAARRARDKSLTAAGARDRDRTGLDWRQDHRDTVARRIRWQVIPLVLVGLGWLVGSVVSWLAARQVDPAAVWVLVWWTPGPRLITAAVAVAAVVPVVVGWRTRPPEAGPAFPSAVTVHRVPDLRRHPGLILDGFEGLGGSTTAQAYRRQRERGVPACTFREDLRANTAGTGLICKVRTPEPATAMLRGNDPEGVMAKALGRATSLIKLSHEPADEADVVTVFVSRRPLGAMDPGDWPLIKSGSVNYFDGVPVGIDEYGDPIMVCLNGTHAVIGGLSGSGKTASGLMPILAGMALDPRVRLFTYWKGGADGVPFAQVSHRIERGNEPAQIDRLVADLEALKTTALARQRFQEDHPELFPGGDITDEACDRITADPALADELDEHLLFPIVIAVDEVRWPMQDERVKELLLWIATQARAACISLVLATQKPSADTIPTEIQGQADIRAGFRVKTDTERDGIYGKGNGIPVPTMRRLARGMSVLDLPDRPDPILVKHHFMALPVVTQVLERAATARRARGLLSGHAAGETPPDPTTDTVLDHLAALVPPLGVGDRIHAGDLVQLLADSHAQYADMDSKTFAAVMRSHGIEPRQVKTAARYGDDAGTVKNLTGFWGDDIAKTVADHITNRPANPVDTEVASPVASGVDTVVIGGGHTPVGVVDTPVASTVDNPGPTWVATEPDPRVDGDPQRWCDEWDRDPDGDPWNPDPGDDWESGR